MKYSYINENEIDKVYSIFSLMNQLSNVSSEIYEVKKMKRYEIVANTFNCSVEKIRKMFVKTWTYKEVRQNKYIYNHYYYEPNLYLRRLNNKRRSCAIEKDKKNYSKYFKVAEFIRKVSKGTNNKTSAKVLSKLIQEKLGIYYSPKHIYWLVRFNRLTGVTLRIFPYLRRGLYYKHPKKQTKRFVSTPIYLRDKFINDRTRFGDVEVDTVEGKKGDPFNLSTMIDRKSRRLAITLYETKQSNKFLEAVKQNINKMTTNVLTITSDNGTENVNLDELKIPWFATNAYSSWQKGTIEQKHKQFRKFVEKGRTFKNLTQEMCDLIALVINAETHLQNPDIYPIGLTVTQDELQTYKELILQNKPNKIFII